MGLLRNETGETDRKGREEPTSGLLKREGGSENWRGWKEKSEAMPALTFLRESGIS